MLLTSLPYSSHSKNLKSKEKIENTNIRGCMDLRAAPDIFNMFESTDRERSSWAGLRDIAIYLPSFSPPILSLREKKLFGWILIFFLRTQSRCFLYFLHLLCSLSSRIGDIFLRNQIQLILENAYLDKCGSWTGTEPLYSFPILKIPWKL